MSHQKIRQAGNPGTTELAEIKERLSHLQLKPCEVSTRLETSGDSRSDRGKRLLRRPDPSTLASRLRDERIARHEAGHAVASVLLMPSRRIELVQINAEEEAARTRTGGFLHYVQSEQPQPHPTLYWGLASKVSPEQRLQILRKHGAILYAGAAAEFPCAQGIPLESWRSARGDLKQYERKAQKLGFERPANCWDWEAWALARGAVDRAWGAVCAVAEALVRFRQLDGDQVLELIEHAPQITNRRRPWDQASAPQKDDDR